MARHAKAVGCRVPKCLGALENHAWCGYHKRVAEDLARTPGIHGNLFRFALFLLRFKVV